MTKPQIQRLVAVILVPLMIALVANAFRKTSEVRPHGSLGSGPSIADEKWRGLTPTRISADPALAAKWQEQEARRKELTWGRDPFMPSGSASKSAGPSLALSGIIYDAAHPGEAYAIISGAVVRQGDELNGVVVQAITADSVTVRYRGELVTLRLGE